MEIAKNVDEYIAHAQEEARLIMEELRRIIIAIVPEVDETISWKVPIYKYHGILAGFSVAKKHVSLGVDTLSMEDRARLKEIGYKTGKKTIQILFGQKVPLAEVQKIIENQAIVNKSVNLR